MNTPEPSNLAYDIAARIMAILRSHEAAQQMFETTPDEQMDFWARQIEEVVSGTCARTGSRPPRPTLSDGRARVMLESLPRHALAYYESRRSRGDRAPEAFAAACRLAYECANHD